MAPAFSSRTRRARAFRPACAGKEVTEFLQKVVHRYRSTLKTDWVEALLFAHRTSKLREVSDQRFGRIFLDHSIGRALTDRLDPADLDWVAKARPRLSTEESLWKVDFTPFEGIELLPGLTLEPSITLFARNRRSNLIRPVAIRIRDSVFLPTGDTKSPSGSRSELETEKWQIAKQLVLQTAAVHLIAVVHPRVHFPADSINAITKATLPDGHLLKELLLPHCYMQLPLNFAVLYIDRSVAHNNPKEIYAPFPCTRNGFFELMKKGYSGVPGNSAFPPYRLQLGAPELPTPYGDFLSAYYGPVIDFSRKVCALIPRTDPAVIRWLRSIQSTLPADTLVQQGPDSVSGQSTFDPEIVAQLAAHFIHNCSVVHSADHYSYGQLPLDEVPLRMRIGEMELSRVSTPEGLQSLQNRKFRRSDIFRHRMAWKMYFRPTTLKPLQDVKYAFNHPVAAKAAEEFLEALKAVDHAPDVPRFVPLAEMATSIQY